VKTLRKIVLKTLGPREIRAHRGRCRAQLAGERAKVVVGMQHLVTTFPEMA
jgi:hypothetical protein